MTSRVCSSCISGQTTRPPSWPKGCVTPWTRSTSPEAEEKAAMWWPVRWLLVASLCALPWRGPLAEPPLAPLVLEATIPLPDTGGRIDHLAVDLRRGRLFVAELGNGTVD